MVLGKDDMDHIKALEREMEIDDMLHEQAETMLATWFDQFADPYAWRVEDYDRFVEFACGCKYPAPPTGAYGTRCPKHDKGVIRVGAAKLRQG